MELMFELAEIAPNWKSRLMRGLSDSGNVLQTVHTEPTASGGIRVTARYQGSPMTAAETGSLLERLNGRPIEEELWPVVEQAET